MPENKLYPLAFLLTITSLLSVLNIFESKRLGYNTITLSPTLGLTLTVTEELAMLARTQVMYLISSLESATETATSTIPFLSAF